MCRGIRPILGQRIGRVFQPECSFRPISIRPSLSSIQRRLENQIVHSVDRLGKRVMIHAAEWVLVLQPKMSGLVSLEAVPDPQHVRLQLDFFGQPKRNLLFWDRRGLGTVELMKSSDIQKRLVEGRLGPDALQISEEEFLARLSQTSRPIKVALMDQKLLAGVGNLYASEMLHQARIHPTTAANRLSKKRKRLLFVMMQKILLDAIEHEGSTLSDGTYRTALNDPGSYQSKHLVYDRSGLPCSTCSEGTVRRIVQAQRSTFYCPRCQKN